MEIFGQKLNNNYDIEIITDKIMLVLIILDVLQKHYLI